MISVRTWSAGIRAALRSPAAPFVVAVVAFLLGRILLLIGGEVFTARDTYVYAYRDDPALNMGPLVSFVGDAPRPWGLPLFYAFFPDDQARATGQWAFGTFAWALLAWELSRHMRTRLASVAVFVAVLLLALFGNVASWDFAILTESMSTSIGVVTVALLLRWRRTGSLVSVALATASAVWWTFIRPDIRIFVAVLIAVLLALAWRAWRRRDAAPDRSGRVQAAAAVIASLVMALGMVWYSAITPRMMETFRPYDGDAIQESPLAADEQLFVFRLRIDVSYDTEMWTAYKTQLGMPTCPELDAMRTRSEWDTVEWARAYTRCPALVAWVQDQPKGALFWSRLATADPALFASKFVKLTSLTLGGEAIAHVPQVLGPIEDAAFPSRRYGLAIALIGLLATVAVAFATGVHRNHSRLFAASILLALSAIGSAVATVIVHSGEYGRFGVQETIATRLAMIILGACALDSWLAARRGSGPAPVRPAVPDRPSDAFAP